MHRLVLIATVLGGVVACSSRSAGEDTASWYSPAEPYDVTEYVAFTDENYDFPSDSNDGIAAFKAAIFPVSDYDVAYGPDDQFADSANCDTVVENDLPWEIEGIVTAHPRFYIKTVGCDRDDEKYYGSYFIQDRTGAIFVLGDSKVAHFDMGDRVKLNVRGAKSSFGLDMVFSHDVVEVERGPFPIYYETQRVPFTEEDISRVKRLTGVVATEPDTFGEFGLAVCVDDSIPEQQEGSWRCADDSVPTIFAITLDVELNRRGVYFPPNTVLEATGPVMYSFSTYAVVIMKVGQIRVIES